jgi:hypothetical protein
MNIKTIVREIEHLQQLWAANASGNHIPNKRQWIEGVAFGIGAATRLASEDLRENPDITLRALVRRFQTLDRQWQRSAYSTDVEGKPVFVRGVAFGVNLALQRVSKYLPIPVTIERQLIRRGSRNTSVGALVS